MQKLTAPLREFFAALNTVPDPRNPRGVRHSCAGILKLVVLGLLCGKLSPSAIAEFGWKHRRQLWRALEFQPWQSPHRTTITRTLAKLSFDELHAAFSRWMVSLVRQVRGTEAPMTVAVDGKAARGSRRQDGQEVMLLNVYAHDLAVAIAGWALPDKGSETTVLKERLGRLLQDFPEITCFTGDALFATRPMAQAIVEAKRDYLWRVKDNQPELKAALEESFAEEVQRPPDAATVGKKWAS